jgi:hypothetical protein
MEDIRDWLEQELQGKVRDETLRHFIALGAEMMGKAYSRGFEDGMSFITTPSGDGASGQPRG